MHKLNTCIVIINTMEFPEMEARSTVSQPNVSQILLDGCVNTFAFSVLFCEYD